MKKRISLIFTIVTIFLFACTSIVMAQDVAPAAPDTTNPPPAPAAAPAPAEPQTTYQIPAVTPDTEIFRRTPLVDGVIEDGEWDIYYTFSTGGWEATTFADWDAGNLYIGVKSNRPSDMMTVIDADDDGWFHGEDNYEFRTTRSTGDTLVLNVSRYESRNTKTPTATPVSPEEASIVEIKSSKSGDSYMIEMRIPGRLVQGLKLSPDRKIGFQIALNASSGDAGWVPSNAIGDTKECTLVTKKFAALKPLEMGFDVRSTTIARGDELVTKFHLTNGGGESMDAQYFVIAGEGKAGDFLSSQKVRLDGLTPKEHVSHEFRSVILPDMHVGSWAVGAEVRSGDTRLGSALVSFDVVEPFEVELRLPDKDVKADVKDVTFGVVVKNNRRNDIRGTAKITLPVGWELWKNVSEREFRASGGGNIYAVAFKAKPPLGALGDIPVKFEVSSDGVTKTLEGKITIVNP